MPEMSEVHNQIADSSIYEEDDYSGDCSDDGLKIVIDSPQSKRKAKSKAVSIGPNEQQIIDSVENEIEKTLEEKAAKANLTTTNVRNLLKHVVTNEHVLAMVRQTEDPDSAPDAVSVYEPKLTRAKAKELFPSQVVAPIPWLPHCKPPPEVQVLISEELPEDSSDDEYVPAEEESEDDKEGSVLSETDPLSVDPPTPKNTDSSTQTNWTDDGVFKIPPVKTKEDAFEEANIALRTRSKLCLSATPLEVIEEAFIPPDITTDMYDMDCDDDDWKDFLKKFTRPLDEVITHAEDEDHDPEYNVLADEEIDKVDKEELRADKGVKVTRKELNELIAELFDFADNFSSENAADEMEIDPQPQFTVLDTQNNQPADHTDSDKTAQQEEVTVKTETVPLLMEAGQKHLLEQQMRQHVQLLMQSFLLSYEHPEYSDIASKCREYLYNLKCLSGGESNSYFVASNLHSAVKLMEHWENKFRSNDTEAQETKEYVAKVIVENKLSRAAGLAYTPTFPPLILETISKSDVFLYPYLLPRIPFKSNSLYQCTAYINSENELIALGLEQFMPFLQDDKYHVTAKGEVRLSHVCHYIHNYMVPVKDSVKLYKHISFCRQPKSDVNPIKYYFENNRAPVTLHCVVPLDQLSVVPPCRRKSDDLPYQWKEYIYPNEQQNVPTFIAVPIYQSNITKVAKPPVFNKSLANKRRLLPKSASIKSTLKKPKRRLVERRDSLRSDVSFNDFFSGNVFSSTPKCRPRKLEQYFDSPVIPVRPLALLATSLKHLKFNSSIFEKFNSAKRASTNVNMLPSMPCLSTPVKRSPERYTAAPEMLGAVNYFAKEEAGKKPETKIDEGISSAAIEEECQKDNMDDINALMVASSTIKTTRRKPSGAQKKKDKIRKEFHANLSMLIPEDTKISEEKTNMFVQAFYDKLQERLDMHDYHRLIEILNGFDESKGSVPDLYRNVNQVLHPKYPDLSDEFLMFLTSVQAKAVGKLVPHLMLNNMSLFLRKLEMYFKEQPSQVGKIYKSLTELSNCVDITFDKVKSSILPLLKGNNLLIDWFLQIFPNEGPPESLLSGPYETIEIGKEIPKTEDLFENITVPEVEDPYGGPNCICSCHNTDDQAFNNRSRHCIPCGTKFLQGRVYVQTGKGLRLAKVSFNSNSNVDHYARLGCRATSVQSKRRSEASPAKQMVSPNKDSQDEVRMSNESEDEVDSAKKKQQKTTKTQKKRKPRSKTEKRVKNVKGKVENIRRIASTSKSRGNTSKLIATESVKVKEVVPKLVVKPEKAPEQLPESVLSTPSLNEQKPAVEEATEWDCNASIESVELRRSVSAESESEGTSQENLNSDSDISFEEVRSPPPFPFYGENSNGNAGEEASWTMDEDKIILETLQREGNREETFAHISQLLENRSISKIKSRFQKLLNLLQAMAAASTS